MRRPAKNAAVAFGTVQVRWEVAPRWTERFIGQVRLAPHRRPFPFALFPFDGAGGIEREGMDADLRKGCGCRPARRQSDLRVRSRGRRQARNALRSATPIRAPDAGCFVDDPRREHLKQVVGQADLVGSHGILAGDHSHRSNEAQMVEHRDISEVGIS